MYLAEKGEAETGLTDAAAHGKGKFVFKQSAVERQGTPLVMTGQLKLAGEGFGIHADSH